MFSTRSMLLELRTPLRYTPNGLVSAWTPQDELYEIPWLEKIRTCDAFRMVANKLLYGVGAGKGEEAFFKRFDITTMIDRASKQQTTKNFDSYLKDFLLPTVEVLLWSDMFTLKFESAFTCLVLARAISIIPAQMDVVIPGKSYSMQFFLSIFSRCRKIAHMTNPKTMFSRLCTKENLRILRHIYPSDLPWYSRDRLLRKDRKFLMSTLQALNDYLNDIHLHVTWVLDTEHVVQYEYYDEIENIGNFDRFLVDIERATRHDLPYTYRSQWPQVLREKIDPSMWYPHMLEFLLEPVLVATESSYWRPNVYLLMIAAKMLQCAFCLRKAREILSDDFRAKQNALIDDLFSKRKRASTRRKVFHKTKART